LLELEILVGAVGIGTLARIENMQLIEKSNRSKRARIGKRGTLERNWNTRFSTIQDLPRQWER
jgi:hypothetical protein